MKPEFNDNQKQELSDFVKNVLAPELTSLVTQWSRDSDTIAKHLERAYDFIIPHLQVLRAQAARSTLRHDNPDDFPLEPVGESKGTIMRNKDKLMLEQAYTQVQEQITRLKISPEEYQSRVAPKLDWEEAYFDSDHGDHYLTSIKFTDGSEADQDVVDAANEYDHDKVYSRVDDWVSGGGSVKDLREPVKFGGKIHKPNSFPKPVR